LFIMRSERNAMENKRSNYVKIIERYIKVGRETSVKTLIYRNLRKVKTRRYDSRKGCEMLISQECERVKVREKGLYTNKEHSGS
jgi:hypothetical protein